MARRRKIPWIIFVALRHRNAKINVLAKSAIQIKQRQCYFLGISLKMNLSETLPEASFTPKLDIKSCSAFGRRRRSGPAIFPSQIIRRAVP